MKFETGGEDDLLKRLATRLSKSREEIFTMIIYEEVDYAPTLIVTKTIIRKVTGSVSAFAMDADQIFKGTSSPSDDLILFRSSRDH